MPSPLPLSGRKAPGSVWTQAGFGLLVVLGLLTVGYVIRFHAWPAPAGPPAPGGLTAQTRQPATLRVHAIAGAAALLIGLAQIGPQGRRLRPGWHRRAGYGYAVSVLASGLAGLSLACSAEGGLFARLGFGTLAGLWLAATARGVWAAICGDPAGHRRAMMRSLALTCAGLTLRLQLPFCLWVGLEFADCYPWVAWTCWVPNLTFAEHCLRRK